MYIHTILYALVSIVFKVGVLLATTDVKDV